MQLPDTIRPDNYSLFFDVLEKTFRGREEISVNIEQPVTEIMLNAYMLKILSAKAVTAGRETEASFKTDDKNETLLLSFKKKMEGKAVIIIEFEAELNDSLLGFYRSRYISGGEEKYIATTQFEAPYARRAFPCFDHPAYKATFDVTIRCGQKLQAISNMPAKGEKKEGGRKIVSFETTPKMSTYLLYLGVGEFEFLESKAGGKLVRVATIPGKKKQAALALEMAKEMLLYFEEYSSVQYPLPKLDLIALPDFSSGAMENWGAIVFREVYLLFDPKITSTLIKKRIAMIIAHELWHQWSGNLVTMKWWNDLWLNESFATFMAYKAVNHFFPEWKTWEDFVLAETMRAMDDDSLKTTHPIEADVKEPHQIEEIFDPISYAKGGNILRMIESYMGIEAFRKGISNYLRKHQYGNAASEDLWESLSEASGMPMKNIIKSWISQPGYPIVEASLHGNILQLRQKRFVFDYTPASTWMIPHVIKTSSGILKELQEGEEKKISLGEKPEWLKLNSGQEGFYRSTYSDHDIPALKKLVLSKKLGAIDRWGLQDDMFELSLNGELPIEKYLEFLEAYESEDSYLVLSGIYANIRHIYFVFACEKEWESIWPLFKKNFKKPYETLLRKLDWQPRKGETQEDSLLRELCVKFLSFVQDDEVIRKGKEIFEKYAIGNPIFPDLRYAVFYITASTGGEKEYQRLVKLYASTDNPEEKRALLMALGQFNSPEILSQVLDLVTEERVRRQDIPFIFASVSSNPMARSFILEWLGKHWEKLQKYASSGPIFLHIIEDSISTNVGKTNELEKFFEGHHVKYKTVKQRALERVRRNTAWLSGFKSLKEYFNYEAHEKRR